MADSVTISSGRHRETKAIGEFFSVLGLPQFSVDCLTEISHLRRRERGEDIVLGLGRYAYFLVDGRISELVQPGKTRLWREVMLFEDISDAALPGAYNDERQNPHTNKRMTSVGMCLSRCMFIQIPNSKLFTLATTDPAIALMFARMATKRHTLTERLYTATRATPLARVAAVLNYLTEPTRRNRIKTREDGVLVMTTTEELIASGPSQADIADALCLGRATVEKAVSELRQLKALRAFEPGERTNRSYPVADRDLLRQIALGG
jgi:CRP-like cAMP-binding protein